RVRDARVCRPALRRGGGRGSQPRAHELGKPGQAGETRRGRRPPKVIRDLLDLLLGCFEGLSLATAYLTLSQSLTRVEGDVDEVKRERANRLTEMLEAEPFARTLRRLALPSRRFVSSGVRPSGGRYWRPAAGSLLDYLSASAASSARVPRTLPS